MHAVAVDRAGARVRQVAVPHFVGVLGHLDALELLPALVVEQAQLHLGRVGGEEGEVDAQPVPRGAKRKWLSLSYPGPGHFLPAVGWLRKRYFLRGHQRSSMSRAQSWPPRPNASAKAKTM